MSTKTQILTPVGRLVMGSLYKAQENDADGKPRVVKSGPNAGQPAPQYFFALAIPKGAEQHWAQTPWGQLIWNAGHTSFPQGQAQQPTFAWKVVDGDSTVPNSRGTKPVDREGYKGHWVLSFSSQYAPKIYNADGTQQFVEPDRVKIGHFVQVAGSVGGNESLQRPGVFLNHQMVAFAAFGPEITQGPDAASVGFGQNVALPAGASAAPLAQGFNPAAPAGAPAIPGVPTPAPAASSPVPMTAAPTVAIVPNPAFLNPPPAATAAALPLPSAPVTLPVPPTARQMTAKAAGHTYEALRAAGWADADLIAQGYMTA